MTTDNKENKISEAFGMIKDEDRTINTNPSELHTIRENSHYPYCRGLITIGTVLLWLAIPILLISGFAYIDSYRTQGQGVFLIVIYVLMAIFNPYVSNLTHLPFDVADLLFEIRNKKDK